MRAMTKRCGEIGFPESSYPWLLVVATKLFPRRSSSASSRRFRITGTLGLRRSAVAVAAEGQCCKLSSRAIT
jgi:hypothetical protein